MVDVWHTASYADCSLSRGFRSINALLAANVCKGKIHIAHFLKFVKVNSTRDEIGVDFSFSIKALKKMGKLELIQYFKSLATMVK